jgi:hypothetical protein
LLVPLATGFNKRSCIHEIDLRARFLPENS